MQARYAESCRSSTARSTRCGGSRARSGSRSRRRRTGRSSMRCSSARGSRRSFEATVSSEEVARGKPAPDVFLEAARRLGRRAGALRRGRGLGQRDPRRPRGRDARRRDPEPPLPAGSGSARARRRRSRVGRRADAGDPGRRGRVAGASNLLPASSVTPKRSRVGHGSCRIVEICAELAPRSAEAQSATGRAARTRCARRGPSRSRARPRPAPRAPRSGRSRGRSSGSGVR